MMNSPIQSLEFSTYNLNGVSSSGSSNDDFDNVEALAQRMLNSDERIIDSSQICDERLYRIWSIGTLANQYHLRQYKRVLSATRFFWIEITTLTASNCGVGLRVRAVDRAARAILSRPLDAFPISPFETNPIPYRLCLDAIKQLHTAVDLARRLSDSSLSPPLHASISIARGEEPPVMPSAPNAFYRIWRELVARFAERAPRLLAKMTIIHGNFCRTNALISRRNPRGIAVVNFENCAHGHPYCDIAQFVMDFSPHHREAFFRNYLRHQALNEEDREDMHFGAAAYLMQEAIDCLQRSEEGNSAEARLPLAELEAIALSSNTPRLEMFHELSSIEEWQRRGAGALAQILQTLEIAHEELGVSLVEPSI